jgi:hypothetical protein
LDSTVSTMQVARALISRQARLIPRSLSPSTLQRSVRTLVLTRRSYAINSTKPESSESPNIRKDGIPPITSTTAKSPGLENALAGPEKLPGVYVNPYKDGPSALDKAMTSFLFTELIRGEWIYVDGFTLLMGIYA